MSNRCWLLSEQQYLPTLMDYLGRSYSLSITALASLIMALKFIFC